MSYTTFEYHGLVLESARPGEAVQGRVCVKNTGTRDGEDVVQVFAGGSQPDERSLALLAPAPVKAEFTL